MKKMAGKIERKLYENFNNTISNFNNFIFFFIRCKQPTNRVHLKKKFNNKKYTRVLKISGKKLTEKI